MTSDCYNNYQECDECPKHFNRISKSEQTSKTSVSAEAQLKAVVKSC